MVVFNGLEYVEELRLTSKEFQEYIRNSKDKEYNYRLELMGKLNCKTKIEWCDQSSLYMLKINIWKDRGIHNVR